MAKMMQDKFKAWARDSYRGCIDENRINELFAGDLSDDGHGPYAFDNYIVQKQWESWQASLALHELHVNEELLTALQELVMLKDVKPHDYEIRKVSAWQNARNAIERSTRTLTIENK